MTRIALSGGRARLKSDRYRFLPGAGRILSRGDCPDPRTWRAVREDGLQVPRRPPRSRIGLSKPRKRRWSGYRLNASTFRCATRWACAWAGIGRPLPVDTTATGAIIGGIEQRVASRGSAHPGVALRTGLMLLPDAGDAAYRLWRKEFRPWHRSTGPSVQPLRASRAR
jgi:hypothetical protein